MSPSRETRRPQSACPRRNVFARSSYLVGRPTRTPRRASPSSVSRCSVCRTSGTATVRCAGREPESGRFGSSPGMPFTNSTLSSRWRSLERRVGQRPIRVGLESVDRRDVSDDRDRRKNFAERRHRLRFDEAGQPGGNLRQPKDRSADLEGHGVEVHRAVHVGLLDARRGNEIDAKQLDAVHGLQSAVMETVILEKRLVGEVHERRDVHHDRRAFAFDRRV